MGCAPTSHKKTGKKGSKANKATREDARPIFDDSDWTDLNEPAGWAFDWDMA